MGRRFTLLGRYNNNFYFNSSTDCCRSMVKVEIEKRSSISFYLLIRAYFKEIMIEICNITGELEDEEKIEKSAKTFTDYIRGSFSQGLVNSVFINISEEAHSFSICTLDEVDDLTSEFYKALEEKCGWKKSFLDHDYIQLNL